MIWEIKRKLVGRCGVYCGACRLYILKKCKGCSVEDSKCPYLECLGNKEIKHCGECSEFPCERHYGPMAVYTKKFLDWKKQEIAKA